VIGCNQLETAENRTEMDLVEFLKTKHIDVLNQSFTELSSLTERDHQLILKVLIEWKSEQAIANLLYYPRLIPEEKRYDILMQALQAEDTPYYMLAAVVGVQTLNRKQFNSALRTKFALQLMEIIKADADIIASRASVVIWDLLDERSFPLYLQLHPVRSASANKNIMALALQKFKDLDKKKFKETLKKTNLSWSKRRKFISRYKKFLKGKKAGQDIFMLAPVYDDIPNLSDIDQRA